MPPTFLFYSINSSRGMPMHGALWMDYSFWMLPDHTEFNLAVPDGTCVA